MQGTIAFSPASRVGFSELLARSETPIVRGIASPQSLSGRRNCPYSAPVQSGRWNPTIPARIDIMKNGFPGSRAR